MVKRNHELVDIDCVVHHETDAAYLIHNGKKKVWVPKSRVEWNSDNRTMTMPEWLAEEKELI